MSHVHDRRSLPLAGRVLIIVVLGVLVWGVVLGVAIGVAIAVLRSIPVCWF
jgi:MFS superfamily sulfate permease-like transporter